MPLSGIPDWRFKPDLSFKFLEEPHEYHLKSKRLWSPSGVFVDVRYVDPSLYKASDRYRGSYVHRALHLIDDGDPGIWKQIHHDFLGYVEAGAEFKEVWKFKPRMREIPIYNPDYLYGVTPDAEGLILGGDEAIVEYKTGTMLWWTAIQTAAQDLAVHAWDKDKKKTRRRIGVELKKNGKFRVKEFDDEANYNAWLSNLTTARTHHNEPPLKE